MKILIRFVHKIAPSEKDVQGPYEGTADDLASLPNARAFLLRTCKMKIGRATGRAEKNRFVVFPGNVGGFQLWHAFILLPVAWVPNEHE